MRANAWMRTDTWSKLGDTQTPAVNDLAKGCKNFGRVLNPDKGDPGFGQNSPEMALHKKKHMRSELNIVKLERSSCILKNYVPLRIY